MCTCSILVLTLFYVCGNMFRIVGGSLEYPNKVTDMDGLTLPGWSPWSVSAPLPDAGQEVGIMQIINKPLYY